MPLNQHWVSQWGCSVYPASLHICPSESIAHLQWNCLWCWRKWNVRLQHRDVQVTGAPPVKGWNPPELLPLAFLALKLDSCASLAKVSTSSWKQISYTWRAPSGFFKAHKPQCNWRWPPHWLCLALAGPIFAGKCSWVQGATPQVRLLPHQGTKSSSPFGKTLSWLVPCICQP